MNWYRAHLTKRRKAEFPRVKIPVLGIRSSEDVFLAEDQMIGSVADAPWRYERLEGANRWVPVDEPGTISRLLLDRVLESHPEYPGAHDLDQELKRTVRPNVRSVEMAVA